MMDCTCQAVCKAKGVYLRVKPRESTVDLDGTKGWAYGVAEKGSDWLGSSTGPYTKEV